MHNNKQFKKKKIRSENLQITFQTSYSRLLGSKGIVHSFRQKITETATGQAQGMVYTHTNLRGSTVTAVNLHCILTNHSHLGRIHACCNRGHRNTKRLHFKLRNQS